MNLGILAAIIFPFGFIILFVLISDCDFAKSSWYDDAKESDYISEKKKLINQVDKESHDKRADYLFCVRNINIIGSNNIPNYMRKIDEYLTSYKLEQFDRFYTVYCKELGDILKKIKDCKCSSLYYNLVTETRTTYGSIFSKMLTDVEAFIKNNSASVTDIEGIKNFAKINGDFDENYKAETASKPVSNTDTTLTTTTSAVEDRSKYYADALVRAYEKVSQYKKENAQLAKELEKCRAEAKKHTREDDLARIDRIIDCREQSGRNDAALKLMRKTRDEIAGNAYRNSDLAYRLYANDALIGAGSWATDYNYDYSDSYFLYDEWSI